MVKYSLVFFFAAILNSGSNAQGESKAVPYNWKNVQISGSGFLKWSIFNCMLPADEDHSSDRAGIFPQPSCSSSIFSYACFLWFP
jgi:hypothetical protein